MKKAIVIVLVLVVLALIVYRISTYQTSELAQSISDIQKAQGVPVEVITAEKTVLEFSRQYSSTVKGFSQTSAIVHLMESVKNVHVDVGDLVSTGDVLMELNKSNPQAQYQQAKLASDNAAQEFSRISALYEQGAVSRQMLDQATLARDIAESNFNNARELVEITAPIDGVVTDVMFRPGEVVSPGDAVVTISTINKVKCELWVGDKDHQQIRTGQLAQVITSGSSTSNFQNGISGKVHEISLSTNPESHLYKVVVVADNNSMALKPGQLVLVRIVIESVPDVLVIPKDAVIIQNGSPFVYKIIGDIAELTPITIGLENRNHLEVSSGLSLGDTIVVYGMNRLKSGDRVKIVSATEEVVNVSQ